MFDGAAFGMQRKMMSKLETILEKFFCPYVMSDDFTMVAKECSQFPRVSRVQNTRKTVVTVTRKHITFSKLKRKCGIRIQHGIFVLFPLFVMLSFTLQVEIFIGRVRKLFNIRAVLV